MQQNKILIVSPDYYPDKNAGAERIENLVRELEGRKISVTVLTHNKTATICDERLVRTFLPKPQNTDLIPLRLFKETLFSIEIFFRIVFSKHFDKVVISPPPFLLMFSSCLACTIRRWPYFLDIRDLYPDVYVHSGLIKEGGIAHRLLGKIEFFSYKNALAIVTVGESLKQRISSRTAEMNKEVYVVRNGYSDSYIKNRSEVKKKQKFSVIMHGNFGYYQDVKLINKINHYLSGESIDLYYVGFGSNFEKIDDSFPHVFKYPSMTRMEISRLLPSFHLGISIRTNDIISKESLPVKTFEYVGAGLPVLITPKGECSELFELEGMGRGFEGIDCSADIADFIKEMSMNPEKYVRYVNCVELNRLAFSRRNQSQIFCEIIDKIG